MNAFPIQQFRQPARRCTLVWGTAIWVACAVFACADEPLNATVKNGRLDERLHSRIPNANQESAEKRADEKLRTTTVAVVKRPVQSTVRERPAEQADRALKSRRVAAVQN